LWRWARSNKLGNKNVIQTTSDVIDKMIEPCWNPDVLDQTLDELMGAYADNEEILLFINYFKEQYEEYFRNGSLDYRNIEQHTRANSCLESYNNHLQKIIPTKPTWFDFVEGLKKEELRVFRDQLEKERSGDYFVSTGNVSKKFIPK